MAVREDERIEKICRKRLSKKRNGENISKKEVLKKKKKEHERIYWKKCNVVHCFITICRFRFNW